MLARSEKLKTKTGKFRFSQLDPVALLDVGYSIHAASDRMLQEYDNAEWKAANKTAALFFALHADPNTPAGEYLLRVNAIVTSHARAITREKQEYIAEVRGAHEEFSSSHGRLRESKVNAFVVKIVWRVGATFLIAGIGFLIAWLIAPFIPQNVGESTGKGLPSLAVALVSGVITWYLSFWLDDLHRGRMIAARHWRETQARREYEKEKIEQQEIHWKLLKRAWHEYTGEHFRGRPPQERVMKGDLSMTQYLYEARTENSRSPIMYILYLCLRFVGKRLKRKG